MKYETILEFARSMRKSPTKAEAFFWDKVRNRRLNSLKFYRQYIIEFTNHQFFIVDFICHERKLIIELDGAIHKHQLDYDSGRTYELEELGYKVIRFSNDKVLNNWENVKKEIMKIAD